MPFMLTVEASYFTPKYCAIPNYCKADSLSRTERISSIDEDPEKKIWDKSKADRLAKTIAASQAIWLVVQVPF